MKKLTVIALTFFLCAACDFFLRVDSDGLKVEIGDNGSDNKTNTTGMGFYVYAVGDTSPFGMVEENGSNFVYLSEGGLQRAAASNDEGADAVFILNSPVEVRLVDICSEGAVVEKAADFNAEAILAACDLSGCAAEGFDMFSYAERNGFDAYCSAE